MVDQKTSTEVVALIKNGRITQDRKVSNEMLQNFSEARLKTQLAAYKKETLAILSTQLDKRVTEKETPNPVAHTIEYSGYFINEAEFDQIKELLGWTNNDQPLPEQQKTP